MIIPIERGQIVTDDEAEQMLRESQGFADSTTAEAERLALETEVKAWIVAVPIVILTVVGAWHAVSWIAGRFA